MLYAIVFLMGVSFLFGSWAGYCLEARLKMWNAKPISTKADPITVVVSVDTASAERDLAKLKLSLDAVASRQRFMPPSGPLT